MTAPQPAPLYWRLLRLRAVRPGPVLRVLLVEGLALAGLVLALGAGVTAWAIVVLPAVGAVVVKAHDLLAAATAVGVQTNETAPIRRG